MKKLIVRVVLACILSVALFTENVTAAEQAAAIDYTTQIKPILTKYCAGCHNADDREGKFSVESFADLQRGGERGPTIVPGQAARSRLLLVLTGTVEPSMPPEDNERPDAAEIALLRAWIDAGAPGPAGIEPDRPRLTTPRIEPGPGIDDRITAMDYWPEGRQLAVARFQRVELQDPVSGEVHRVLDELPGKVNAVHYVEDGRRLLTASGVSGLYGQATLWNLADGKRVRDFVGHRDILFDAEFSPDGRTMATCSYDRRITLWDVSSGEILRTMDGHNDAVYDLAFSPDGTVLATASGDETVKLWLVESGERLDTLSQPQAEQYAVTFSPDGQFVLAGGADNRIRIWRFVSRTKPRINPLVHARFAHDGAIVGIAFSQNGEHLVSAAEDRTLKLWETATFSQTHVYERQPDQVTGLAVAPGYSEILAARVNGSIARYPLPQTATTTPTMTPNVSGPSPTTDEPLNRIVEHEPNDHTKTAMTLYVPARIEGTIHAFGEGATDQDLFRFSSKAGQEWVLEVRAAANDSPLDSKIEVLSVSGKPIERVKLQAVRDSYFTFRGKDSSATDDFRLHNWEEMELNEFLFANGEVVKLFHYPRGPDSGFQVYAGRGKRFTYFDTTAMSHALHEPVYVVEPHEPQATLIPNGLPVFRLYYENDDDGRRELGNDSRLNFRAPADGEYLARIADARGFHGAEFKYELSIRQRRPDFKITLDKPNITVGAGSGQEFSVQAQRFDGFDGEIQVDIQQLPPGFRASTPLVIEAGQTKALGAIYADANAQQPAPEAANAAVITATATIHGHSVHKDGLSLGEIKLGEAPKVLATILPADATADHEMTKEPLEFVIAPGETITAKVRIERNGFEGRVGFGTADAGRNMPHGVYVDNIGLNGLLIVEDQDERTFFITAAEGVRETSRLFHLRTEEVGNVTTAPVLLHVRRPVTVANADPA
jgi:WD40 repeat protein/mono/diheme cytochrome c family protein